MNATAELLTNASDQQKALYAKGMKELRQQFVSMSDAELGCNGCCENCRWVNLCDK